MRSRRPSGPAHPRLEPTTPPRYNSQVSSTSLEDKLSRLPDRPGVYIYKDAKAQVVYVGKAASLRSRVRSYFQEARPHDAKTDALVRQIADL
jgi:excinuclease UvrABC nuclease subunit